MGPGIATIPLGSRIGVGENILPPPRRGLEGADIPIGVSACQGDVTLVVAGGLGDSAYSARPMTQASQKVSEVGRNVSLELKGACPIRI